MIENKSELFIYKFRMGGRILFYRKNIIFRFPKKLKLKKKITLSVPNPKRWGCVGAIALQLVQIQQNLTRSFRHRMKLMNGAVWNLSTFWREGISMSNFDDYWLFSLKVHTSNIWHLLHKKIGVRRGASKSMKTIFP